MDYLEAQGLITVLKGKRYKKTPTRTRLFPKDVLCNQIWEYVLDLEQPIEGPYYLLKITKMN
ncbi:MAG: hypothetical protein CMK36_09375 [Porticoccaceae bacterium]|nr:hypothetical protein [Porticoccaceae bacterium]